MCHGPKRIADGVGAAHQLHADAAAAGGALEHHGVADARRLVRGLLCVAQQSAARKQRNSIALRQFARRMLEAEVPHLRRRRPDEYETRRRAAFGEARVLAQEAVPWMDGLCARRKRRGQQLVLLQIVLGGRAAAERHRFVGLRHVQRMPVGVRMDGNGSDLQALQGSDDAAGDLAAIRHQNLSEHPRPK